MEQANIKRPFFTLGFSLVLITGLGSCDDAPEEPKEKSWDRQKMMQDKLRDELQNTNKGNTSLPLLSFNMQHNKKSIALNDGDRDKILRIADSLCNIGSTGGTTSSETYKTKIGELTAQIANLGYKSVSLKIIKGSDELGSQQQEIDIQIKNKQNSVNCSLN